MSTVSGTYDLHLTEHPTGLGLHGQALMGDALVHVNILPPAYLWEASDAPPYADATHWRVYADGDLLGRIKREEDVGPALRPLLAERLKASARASSRTCDTEVDQ